MSSSSFLEMIAATKEARIRYRQELCYAVMPVAVSYYIDLPSGDKEAKAADEVVSFVDTLLDRLVKASKITFQRRTDDPTQPYKAAILAAFPSVVGYHIELPSHTREEKAADAAIKFADKFVERLAAPDTSKG